ncbi:hypothetical protein [Bailinhaonella thermotolerans]|uniref:hypothetical protein n=1 Tax=Bailinhaonella thermotolerans TaxID=1070861 RepID=UPI0011C3D289|nr:hypothetical protein [Bailinhaonella thermotolerans]
MLLRSPNQRKIERHKTVLARDLNRILLVVLVAIGAGLVVMLWPDLAVPLGVALAAAALFRDPPRAR